ncbi:nucleoside phosphorylase [Fluviicola taffensis]|uniref:Uridine phosphorylase n=1 Tax=Fluviicola taffensis (strain DSM 16823 / NCIMB 13979 / RW262) TaxID=755732 RepID=F2IG40_FLUTR|nr:nucleoside phosphorylase [Fluviicola taffensis]AEA44675.1 purine or other phosphorylase family 1 [Fluviicola taffensis DSM 16823]
MKYPASELVLDSKGNVYHLGISPENIAPTILLVGDQDRVALISSFFDKITHQSKHREFVCHTGTYKGKQITALSTGIGTDNIDIVINELDALVNIDLTNRQDKKTTTSLNLIRIGTCGILQADIPVHSYLLSTHAIGIDNVAHFYPIEFNTQEKSIAKLLDTFVGFPEEITPYCSESSPSLLKILEGPQTYSGITVTSSGFYAPQGRSLRLGTRTQDINEKLEQFEVDQHRVINFEMESSALFSLGKAMGHQCVTICLGIANRPLMEFSKGYEQEMNDLIKYVLDRV